jgi:hypothetical protein
MVEELRGRIERSISLGGIPIWSNQPGHLPPKEILF